MGLSGVAFWQSWVLLGSLALLLGVFGGLRALLEPPGSVLAGLGDSWCGLRCSLGCSLEGLGVHLGRSWVVLGDPWELLGCFVRILDRSWGALGVGWVGLRGLLPASVDNLKQQGRCKAKTANPNSTLQFGCCFFGGGGQI